MPVSSRSEWFDRTFMWTAFVGGAPGGVQGYFWVVTNAPPLLAAIDP